MAYPEKTFGPQDPHANLPKRINWATWLTAHGSDTITSSTWTVTPAGLTTTETYTTTTATIKISGGTAGVDYDLSNDIVTAGGLSDRRTIRVPVADR